MSFDQAKVVENRASLQAFATWKYDEYEQYWPGERFLESLARWLDQFDTTDRPVALEFVRRRLLFVSRAEIQHLVSMAFTDFVRPILFRKVAASLGVKSYYVGKIAKSDDYTVALRRTLFLGLSDGAHIDVFRKYNPQLSNEQVWLTYEVSAPKVADLQRQLAAHLKILLRRDPTNDEAKFQHLVLLDDFSGSGEATYEATGKHSTESCQRSSSGYNKTISLLSSLQTLAFSWFCT